MWMFYEFLLLAAFMLYLPKALTRRRLPHRGWSMRLGRYPQSVRQRLDGRPTIWVHAVSVGEVQAARPLLQALLEAPAQDPIVLSTITHSGFAVAHQQASERILPVYFPLDLRPCVRRALDALQPRLLLLMESELWPLMIDRAQARGIPVVVVNGRMSARAFRRYRWGQPWVRRMMRQVSAWLMQTQEDADRVTALGAPQDRLHILGSLKWDASLGARPSESAIADLALRLGLNGQEQVLVAGSTHRGEEGPLVQAYQELRRTHAGARLILAPRHLERLGEVDDLVQYFGLTPRRLSSDAAGQAWDVGIVDTFGQLPLYYGMASAVFIGGSLIPHGGQNPLEAASLGKPVLFGPFMHNFSEIVQQLLQHRAARQLRDGTELQPALSALLSDAAQARAMGLRARELVERSRGATQRTLELLAPFLTPASSGT